MTADGHFCVCKRAALASSETQAPSGAISAATRRYSNKKGPAHAIPLETRPPERAPEAGQACKHGAGRRTATQPRGLRGVQLVFGNEKIYFVGAFILVQASGRESSDPC